MSKLHTQQIGGSDAASELNAIHDYVAQYGKLASTTGISDAERQQRRDQACLLMQQQGIDATLLTAGSSLYYFTGLSWYPSERLTAALLCANGHLRFICPAFEESKLRETLGQAAIIDLWQEEDSPCALLAKFLSAENLSTAKLALDESAAFFIYDNLRQVLPHASIVNAASVTGACRMHKSAQEIALMQSAKNITLRVQAHAARILRDGIGSFEVARFINQAHQAYGGSASTFCIVSFGAATAMPHGPDGEQFLHEGDMVLIDTGCKVQNYHSDITRSYVFGAATARQQEIWDLEKAAQAAAFARAEIGVPCELVDAAARQVLQAAGLGPDYRLPGLPHRTGHGIGLDIHEWTYLVKGNKTPLAAGMCFSNEPMICIEGEFGVRLEDHFYMTPDGPRWFSEPSPGLQQPFASDLLN